MDSPPASLEERRSAMVVAVAALESLDGALHQASGPELGELMGVSDRLAALASAGRVSIAVEAVSRGAVAESGTNVHTWVRDHAPSLRQGGSAAVAVVATAVTKGGPTWNPEGGGPDPESALGIVWAGVRESTVSASLASAALAEVDRLAPLLREDVLVTATSALVELGTEWGPTVMRRLRPRLIAEYGRQGVLDDLQEKLAGAARLSSPVVESADLTEYQLLMTPEQAATLEAAIGPLSAPAPNDETGERDLRPAGQRRVEALTQVCQRSSAMGADGCGADGAAGSWSAVHVSVTLEDLRAGTGCGEVIGSTATGTILSPEVLRRVSCEAALIPYVLGTAGEDVDMGRGVRLFTRAQRRRLMRRDRGCTFPGCTAPASWAKAHHVTHWVDGGLSDLDNAALLCQLHHTLVHRRRLIAEVRAKPDGQGRCVVWDLNHGSYDRHLDALTAERSAHDPPPLTPERLRSLLLTIGGGDQRDQCWAEYELAASSPDEGATDAELDEAFSDEYRASFEPSA